MPKISVVICAFNAERYIAMTIESIIHQTYKDWELVIVDDGSTDKTSSIVGSFIGQGYPIHYHYQENQGFGYSRNKVLELAKGEWIAIIDHDDLCMPNRLEVQMAAASKNPDAALIFSDSVHFKDDGTIIRKQFDLFNPCKLNLEPGHASSALLIHGCFIDSETAFFKKEAALEAGGFDSAYGYVTDYDFFLKLGLRYGFFGVDEVLSQWRVHSKQLSQVASETILLEHCRLYSQWSHNLEISQEARRVAKLRNCLYMARAMSFYGFSGHFRQSGKFFWRFIKAQPFELQEYFWFLNLIRNKLRIFIHANFTSSPSA